MGAVGISGGRYKLSVERGRIILRIQCQGTGVIIHSNGSRLDGLQSAACMCLSTVPAAWACCAVASPL